MKQVERKNHGTMIVQLSKENVGASGVIIAKLPVGTRIHSVNVTVDEAFNGTDNKITVGVAGTLNKFQNAFSLAALAGNTSTRQHSVEADTAEIIMSIEGTTPTAGAATVTIDYALPTSYSVEY